MKHTLVVILVILVLLLPACERSHYYPPSSGNPPPETSYHLSTSVSPSGSGSISLNPSNGVYDEGTSVTLTAQAALGYVFDHWGGGASGTSPIITITMDSDKSVTAYFTHSSPPETVSAPSTPLNVRIDYIGVKDAYDSDDPWDPQSEVQLVVVVTDGETATPEDEVFIPWDKEGYKMESFETKAINQRVFHTSSVGSYLRISVAAWDIDSKNETLNALSVLEAFGIAGAAELRALYDMLPQEDDRIGDYSHTWYADENWSIGPHEISADNLLLGFSIYSDREPSLIPEPSILPDVKIQSVDMPSEVKQSNPGWYYFSWYSNNLTVVNNEDIPLVVDWDAYSSAKGAIFASGTVTIPANGHKSVPGSYYYDTPIGPLTETYTIYYRGKKLDSWSGTLNVVPGPYS